MADLCSSYNEVYNRSHRKLSFALPVYKVAKFFPETQTVFKDNDKTDVEQRSRSTSRSTLLNLVKEDLEAGNLTSFEQLLKAMAAYIDAEKDIVVDRILRTMMKEIKGITECNCFLIYVLTRMYINCCSYVPNFLSSGIYISFKISAFHFRMKMYQH